MDMWFYLWLYSYIFEKASFLWEMERNLEQLCSRKLIDYSCLNIMALAILLESIVIAEMIAAIIRVFTFPTPFMQTNLHIINLNGKLLFDELHYIWWDKTH